MKKLEKILETEKIRRFNNSGEYVALVVPPNKKIAYGIGGMSDNEADAANLSSFNAFFAEISGRLWEHPEAEKVIKARGKGNGLYIFHVYFLETGQIPKVIVPYERGFLIYSFSDGLEDYLNEKGYKIKNLNEEWYSKNVFQ
ncbi:MAG: hypothetical protein N3D84_02020 [Candidatus Woesearchaeota archaeon]|nr:hypothetical protein [Candidatus Woesearchaeota archaeon]